MAHTKLHRPSAEATLPRRYAQIPEPGDSIESMRLSITALKNTVEELTGQSRIKPGSGGNTNTIFFLPETPPKANRRGDLWVYEAGDGLFGISAWDDGGKQWIQIK